jgi:hypothetical protein
MKTEEEKSVCVTGLKHGKSEDALCDPFFSSFPFNLRRERHDNRN